jgi:drug/metabolite transporter (DMT)-like permease
MNKKWQPYVVLHSGIFLVSFTGVLGKALSLREGVIIWYRMFLCVVLLSLFGLLTKRLQMIRKEDRLRAALIGALFCIHWLLWYASIKVSNASVAMSTISTVAVFTAVIEPLISARKFLFRDFFLAAVAGFGMFLIFDAHAANHKGVIYGVVSALLVAFASIFNKELTARNDPFNLTLFEFGSALLTVTLIMPFYLYFNPGLQLIPQGNDWWLLPVFVVFCTLTPFIMNLYALRHVSAFTSNLSFNMEPVWGIAAAIIFFGENKDLNAKFYLGLAFILSSVLIYTWMKYREGAKQTSSE